MMVDVGTAKTVGSTAWDVGHWLWERWRRPTIAHKRAPRNFFDHVRLGVSSERVRELLGPPPSSL